MHGSFAAVTADPLFVGATRPPMRWGVTYSALLFNLVFTLEAFLLTRNLLTLLIAVPIHGLCALLCAHDARYFDLLALAARTRLPAYLGNWRLWRAVSYAPLTLDAPDRRARRRVREVCCWCAGPVERRTW
jgi:type IV secretion system protein VirB3